MRISPLGCLETQTEQMKNLVLKQLDYSASKTLHHCFCHRGFHSGKVDFSEIMLWESLIFPGNFFQVKEIFSQGILQTLL